MTSSTTSVELRLKITEIFFSIQGEANQVGWPTVFVRLTGCPLRCQYCDTAYAFTGGEWWTIEQVLARVRELGLRHVCVTGGEPLAQKNALPLLRALCDAGHEVSLETSGAIDISGVDARVTRVVDVKTPASREAERNRWQDLAHLRREEQLKFVICDRSDFDWALAQVRERGLADVATVLFSPSNGQLDARTLAEWILAERAPVRFQVQLHKYLWGDVAGH
jgi:7-carboxy-7-deazaguanine synthase